MDKPGINRLCLACANRCKQSDSVRIVECPNYEKKPTEREFRIMVDDLVSAEETAKGLRKRARELITEALGSDKEITIENNGIVDEIPGTGNGFDEIV